MSVLHEIVADLKAAILGLDAEAPPLAEPEETAELRSAAMDEPDIASQAQVQDQARLRRAVDSVRHRSWYQVAAVVVALVVIVSAAWLLVQAGWMAKAPGKEVVATYVMSGDVIQITKDDLRAYMAQTPQAVPVDTDSYRSALLQMVTDQLLWDGLLGRLGPSSMRYMVANVIYDHYPVSTFQDVIASISIDDSQVRDYYERYAYQWPARTLSEVRTEIVELLRQQRSAEHVEAYVAGLRETMLVVEHPEVVALPDVDDSLMRTYYESHRDQLRPPREAIASFLRFHLLASSLPLAETARQALEEGQDLETVRRGCELQCTAVTDATLIEGQHSAEFDEVLFGLQPGQVSDVIDGGDAYYVVVMKQLLPQATGDYDSVKDEIQALLWAGQADAWFEARAEEVIFEINGDAYRAGDFYAAFDAQPQDVQAPYHSTEGFQALVDRTIDWLLVLEDARRQGYRPDGSGDLYTRLQLLESVAGVEEPTDLTIDDDEVYDYYTKHPQEFTMPTRFKVRYLAFEAGDTHEEKNTAWINAQEAYARLDQPGGSVEENEFLEIAALFVENPTSGIPSDWIVASRPQDIEVLDPGVGLMAHPLYDVLRGLQAGDLSEPVEVEGIVYVVEVLEREEEHLLDLYAATGALDARVGMERARAVLEELSQPFLEEANLTIYERNLRGMRQED